MFKRILIIILVFLASLKGANAQFDPQFSQNMFNQMYVNPAYAGMSDVIDLVALNRNQWRGSYAIKTTVFTGNMPVNIFGNSSGVGLSILSDEIGLFTNLSIQASYSYHIELAEGTLSGGLSLGVFNQSFDGSGVDLEAEGDIFTTNDPVVTQSSVSGTAFDADFGMYYKSDKYYAGLSVKHLTTTKPNYKDEFYFEVPVTYYATAGCNLRVQNTLYEVLPSFFLKTDGKEMQLDVGGLLRYNERFWGGLSYRIQDAFIVMFGIEMRNGVRFGYSYDMTTSAISASSQGGTHEIMIGYSLNVNFDKRTKRYKSVRYL